PPAPHNLHSFPTRRSSDLFSEPKRNEDDDSLLDATYDISFALEKWVRSHSKPVIFILDNFEGVARLPLRNSDRLRSIGDNCAFIDRKSTRLNSSHRTISYA